MKSKKAPRRYRKVICDAAHLCRDGCSEVPNYPLAGDVEKRCPHAIPHSHRHWYRKGLECPFYRQDALCAYGRLYTPVMERRIRCREIKPN
jgi:hypothetical protein